MSRARGCWPESACSPPPRGRFLSPRPALANSLAQITWVGWTALAFLALLCALIGLAVWFWALDQGGVASIAPLQFGQPIVSLIIAVTLLSVGLCATIVLALCLISCGVYLSRRAP
ncbi:EamA family transporter [Bradyrhizobium liaoningense]|uniref:EamA family transporter n=1 Tax=Bradyrhizobium liaoningense TaxID=43992 RepID=UPI001BA8B2C6|nr:EamA family transporter [Bradyrhizobium liaoningense]